MNGCFNMIGGGSAKPKLAFSFDGVMSAVQEDEEGNWEFAILSTGNLVFKKDPGLIDVFLVGGGGSGSGYAQSIGGGNGGGGGYTLYEFGLSVEKNKAYLIEVGDGGAESEIVGVGYSGGTTSAFGYYAEGGDGGENTKGGNGGSGGGGGLYNGGDGGSDGSDGEDGDYDGGFGQSWTTKAFGEENREIYAGGGGGTTGGKGGAGGGGNAWVNGVENTGGGGGGGGAAGGSGVVIIRNHRGAVS